VSFPRGKIWVVVVLLVDGKLTPLSKSFCAAIDTAYKRLGTSVSIFMLFQVLRQGETFLTKLADVFLLVEMPQVVSLERELAGAKLLTVSYVTFKHFLSH